MAFAPHLFAFRNYVHEQKRFIRLTQSGANRLNRQARRTNWRLPSLLTKPFNSGCNSDPTPARVMRTKKLLAGLFLAAGSAIVITFAHSVITRDAETRSSRLVGGLLFGAPPIALGGWLLVGASRSNPRHDQISLRSILYRLLKQNSGHLTVTQFAAAANLPRTAAQSYLDERAKEFDAKFAVSADGSLAYQFYVQDKKGTHLTETLRERLANSDFNDITIM